MADPISITGLIIDVSHILASIIQYAKTVKSAKAEIRKLSEELFALKGILEHLAAQSSGETSKFEHVEYESETSSGFDRSTLDRVLQQTNEFLQSILKDLEPPESKFQKIKQKLEWPMSKEDVSTHLVTLERVKSWLILVLMADSAAVERDIQQDIRSLARSMSEDLRIRDEERTQQTNRELYRWIAPVSPGDTHLRVSRGRPVISGKWFITGKLKHWLRYENQEKIFYLVGKSGTGKTTLFAQIVDELSRDPSTNIAYFYCTITIYDKIPTNQSHKPPADIAALENAIIEATSEKSQVILLLDAINESEDREGIEKSLQRIAHLSSSVRIIVTTTVAVPFQDLTRNFDITAEMMRGDIKAYIDYRLVHDETLRNLKPDLKASIAETLLHNADGSFRWVQLSLDNLQSQRTAKAMKLALSNLPGSLRETYVSTLERISPDDWVFVREALFWLSFASRPFWLGELNEAVVIDEECTELDQDMMLVPPQLLLHLCQGLISQDRLGQIRLAHASVKEFLTSEWIRTSRVKYFSLDPATATSTMMRGYEPDRRESTRYIAQYRFIRYAAHYWADHAASCELGEAEQKLVKRFFDTGKLPRRGNFGVWVQTLIPGVDASVIEMTQPLYYAASFGMMSVVKAILASDSELDIDAPGGRVGATALFAASNRHNYAVAEVLLQAGADPAIVDPGTGFSVLSLGHMNRFSGLRGPLARWSAGKENPIWQEYLSQGV
ncbi:hypothetical protein N7470_005381 [Penicillium chermesinum]|nr:hypothetical protein N7470_005381 [Penicillium chermesinum]